ncbi:MAG: MaoC family dehydratase [Rhizomicrobium sp.]|jgi:acyl dehydratase
MTNHSASNGWTATLRGQPKIGDQASRRRKTRNSDILRFTEITGDRNPLHYDEAAASTRFGGLIVQGGVTSGLLNALVAEDMPGPGTVFLEVQWKFVKAVRVGEEIVARARVVAVRDDKPICTLETTVTNRAGDLCLKGTVVTYTVPLKRRFGVTS